MFSGIGDKLTKALKKLKGVRFLNEEQINETLRDIRIALIEADVGIQVIQDINNIIREKALGIEVVRTISPSQMIVKIVYDTLVSILGGDVSKLSDEGKYSIESLMRKIDGPEGSTEAEEEKIIDKKRDQKSKNDKKRKKKNQSDALKRLNQSISDSILNQGVKNNTPKEDNNLDYTNIEKDLNIEFDLKRSHKNELNLNLNCVNGAPAIIMMIGLQGAGKTTTAAKLALYLRKKHKKNPLLVSVDVYRPAAQLQLHNLGKQVAIDTLPIVDDQKPIEIVERALDYASTVHADVIIIDTAGRLNIDEQLMSELIELKGILRPNEVLFVVDSMIGQESVKIVQDFDNRVGISGIVITKTDSDARCGAIISMKHITGKDIKFLGAGEKLNELQMFYPERIASRVLGMGDVVSLVENAIDEIGRDEAQKLAKKVAKGNITMNDLLQQINNIKKLGSISSILEMIPGLKNLQAKIGVEIDESNIKRQVAMIHSMTEHEKENPDVIDISRQRRIALGAGVEIKDIKALLKNFEMLKKTMKKMRDPKALKQMMAQLAAGGE